MSCSDDLAIKITGVSKTYPVYARREDRLKQLLFGWSGTFYTPFHALSDINLEIRKGESFGIIGRNGSGKSTLLQIIAGTLAPTSGEVHTNGRVGALLELGAGFNPEFSGRENVFLNAAILGLTRAETEEKFDDIAAFADIGAFMENPVKQYSSGMFMRLAFAVQAHVASDVLIIDEALAVGDVFFRQKCFRHLLKMRERGTTIMMVSHSVNEIEQHCDRALLLDHGKAVFIGEATEAAKQYYMLEQRQRVGNTADAAPQSGDIVEYDTNDDDDAPYEADFDLTVASQVNFGLATCSRVALVDGQNQPVRSVAAGEKIVIQHEYVAHRDLVFPFGGIIIHATNGAIVHGRNTLQLNCEPVRRVPAGATVSFRQEITLNLARGEYTIEVGLGMLGENNWPAFLNWTPEEFEEKRLRLVQVPSAGAFSVRWKGWRGVEAMPHYGLANMPGQASMRILPARTEAASETKASV